MSAWLRDYNSFASDPVIQALAFEDQRHLLMVWALKSQGVLDRGMPADALDAVVASALRLSIDGAAAARNRLLEYRLIDEMWQPRNVARDKNAKARERTAKWRNRNKNQDVADGVTFGDVTVTPSVTSPVTPRVTLGDGHQNVAGDGGLSESGEAVSTPKIKAKIKANIKTTPVQSDFCDASVTPSVTPSVTLGDATPQDPPTVAITLPLNTGAQHPILDSHVQTWAALFPAVDVPQQLRNMRAWLDANPRRRKTRAGVLRFVVAWLGKEQDRPRPNGGQHAAHQRPDTSAIGQIRSANQRARAEREASERRANGEAVGAHGNDVRPPLEGEFRPA